jgi:HD-GYP domain-containing protein (c-di-GMP phosphodiesterase class II)
MAIVRGHHEKWNGQGYPDRLSNSSIPLGARILAVADTFDAITSNRSYRHSRSVAEALEILVDSSGYDFDPKVVDAMVSWVQKIRSQEGNADRLALENLLGSNTQPDPNSEPKLIAKACAADGVYY